MKIGIVGLPNVGKSTLFNTLTQRRVPAENYPFCTIDPAVGVVAVPDERLEKLAALSRSAKVIPAAVEFVDIAGLIKGASEGEGLGNQFLSYIRGVDAILHLVRVFRNDEIVHVAGEVRPLVDIETVNAELRLADLPITEKYQLLTAKPVLYVFNQSAGDNVSLDFAEQLKAPFLTVNASTGEGLDQLIQAAYRLLGLITFFTTGDPPPGGETRAWTIKQGSTTPEAGAAIHSDFRDKFIRALVIHYDDLFKAGSLTRVREQGLLRTEGRDYVVQDGDVIEFKI